MAPDDPPPLPTPIPPPPTHIAPVRPSAAPAAPQPKANVAIVKAKARPPMGPFRPTIVHPRPLSPWGDAPGFLFSFETTTTRVFVPKAMAEAVIHGRSLQESEPMMDLVIPGPAPPKAFQVYQRPPIYMIDDETEDETLINTFPINYPALDDEARGAGGSSSSRNPQ
jgi:hypothetical protein